MCLNDWPTTYLFVYLSLCVKCFMELTSHIFTLVSMHVSLQNGLGHNCYRYNNRFDVKLNYDWIGSCYE